jgi:hypothetical protein
MLSKTEIHSESKYSSTETAPAKKCRPKSSIGVDLIVSKRRRVVDSRFDADTVDQEGGLRDWDASVSAMLKKKDLRGATDALDRAIENETHRRLHQEMLSKRIMDRKGRKVDIEGDQKKDKPVWVIDQPKRRSEMKSNMG